MSTMPAAAMPDAPMPIAPMPIAPVRPHTARASQVVTVIAVVVPPLALLSAMGVLWGIAFHAYDLAIFLALYVLGAFGTTIGFHRHFPHRSFDARLPVKT